MAYQNLRSQVNETMLGTVGSGSRGMVQWYNKDRIVWKGCFSSGIRCCSLVMMPGRYVAIAFDLQLPQEELTLN